MSVVITGLPARPAFVPAASISSTSTVTGSAGSFLSALRAAQGNADSDAGVKTLPDDAAPVVSQFAGAAFPGRQPGLADNAVAPVSPQAATTTPAKGPSGQGASGQGTFGEAISGQAASSGAEPSALNLTESVRTDPDPGATVDYASRAVVSGLPAPKLESAAAGGEPAHLSARKATAQEATAADRTTVRAPIAWTLAAGSPAAPTQVSPAAALAPAIAPDAPVFHMALPQALPLAGALPGNRPDAFPSVVPTSASGSSKDRARPTQVVSGEGASTPATVQPAAPVASNTLGPVIGAPPVSPARDPVPATADAAHQSDRGAGVATANVPTQEAPSAAPATQPSVRADTATLAASARPQGAVTGITQAADVPTLQIKLRAQGSDTAKAADQAATPQPLRSQVADQRAASTGHGDGEQASGQGQNAASAADPSNIPAAAPLSFDPGVQAQAALSASPLSGTTEPAAPAAASPMAAPASDLVTSGAVPTSPVSQVGSALLTLSTGRDGTQQMSLRLHPEELGTVEVRIDRAPDGSARVSVTADNPNTLQMMSGAQDDLHKALDAAGIPAGRALSFALGTETRPPNGLADLAFRPVTEDRSASQQSSGGTPGQSGNTGAGQGSGNQGLAGGSTGSGGNAHTGSQGGGEAWANYAAAFQPGVESDDDSSTGSFQPEGI